MSSYTSGTQGARRVLGAGVVCCGTIAGPALLLAPARRYAGPAAVTAMLALAPVAASAAVAVRRNASVPAKLGPGLLALAGALVLLPVAEPTTAVAATALALSAAAALLLGFSAGPAQETLIRLPAQQALFVASSANALLLWLALLLQSGVRVHIADLNHLADASALLFETGIAALSILLLRLLPPTVYSSRYLWTPLIAAAEGYVLLRPSLSWRPILGAAMLAAGGVLLLRQRRSVPDEILGLREILLEGMSEERVDSEHGRFDVHRRRG